MSALSRKSLSCAPIPRTHDLLIMAQRRAYRFLCRQRVLLRKIHPHSSMSWPHPPSLLCPNGHTQLCIFDNTLLITNTAQIFTSNYPAEAPTPLSSQDMSPTSTRSFTPIFFPDIRDPQEMDPDLATLRTRSPSSTIQQQASSSKHCVNCVESWSTRRFRETDAERERECEWEPKLTPLQL